MEDDPERVLINTGKVLATSLGSEVGSGGAGTGSGWEGAITRMLSSNLSFNKEVEAEGLKEWGKLLLKSYKMRCDKGERGDMFI